MQMFLPCLLSSNFLAFRASLILKNPLALLACETVFPVLQKGNPGASHETAFSCLGRFPLLVLIQRRPPKMTRIFPSTSLSTCRHLSRFPPETPFWGQHFPAAMWELTNPCVGRVILGPHGSLMRHDMIDSAQTIHLHSPFSRGAQEPPPLLVLRGRVLSALALRFRALASKIQFPQPKSRNIPLKSPPVQK